MSEENKQNGKNIVEGSSFMVEEADTEMQTYAAGCLKFRKGALYHHSKVIIDNLQQALGTELIYDRLLNQYTFEHVYALGEYDNQVVRELIEENRKYIEGFNMSAYALMLVDVVLFDGEKVICKNISETIKNVFGDDEEDDEDGKNLFPHSAFFQKGLDEDDGE